MPAVATRTQSGKNQNHGAALRKLREMAGLCLEEVQDLYPISYSRLSRVERDRAELSPAERTALEQALSAEIRRRARELNDYMHAYDGKAIAV